MTTGRINQVSTNRKAAKLPKQSNHPYWLVRELATELTGQRKPLLRQIGSEPLNRQGLS